MIESSLKLLLWLSLILSPVSANLNWFSHKPQVRKQSEYITLLFGRWARTPRDESNYSPGNWLADIFAERQFQDLEMIPGFLERVTEYAENSEPIERYLNDNLREWISNKQNKMDLKLLLDEINNASTDKDCTANSVDDTLGALDSLFDLRALLRKAEKEKRLPFFDSDDIPEKHGVLYKYLWSKFRDHIVVCFKYVPYSFRHHTADAEPSKVEKYFDSLFEPHESWWNKKGEQKLVDIFERARKTYSFRELSSVRGKTKYKEIETHCMHFTEVIGPLMVLYNLASILNPRVLNNPYITAVHVEERFKKFNEYDRLCNRYLIQNKRKRGPKLARFTSYPESIPDPVETTDGNNPQESSQGGSNRGANTSESVPDQDKNEDENLSIWDKCLTYLGYQPCKRIIKKPSIRHLQSKIREARIIDPYD